MARPVGSGGKSAGGRRRRRLAFSAEPFASWPEALRSTWDQAALPEWHRHSGVHCRHAYGRLRAYCRTIGKEIAHTAETVQDYADYLQRHLPQQASQEVRRLHTALTILVGDQDWTWLLQHARALQRPLCPPTPRKKPRTANGRCVSLPFECWPLEDRALWQKGTARPSAGGSRLARYTERRDELAGRVRPFAPSPEQTRTKPPYQWSAATLRSARQAYGSFLKCRLDQKLDTSVTPDTVATWVEGMLGRMTQFSAGNRVRDLWYAVRLMHPDHDWRWLREDAASLFDGATSSRDKLSHIADVRDIRRAAIARMKRAERRPRTIAAALEFQDGLVMLLLSYRPVRRRNIAETRLGINLSFDESFTHGRLIYGKTKNGDTYDTALPEAVLPWLSKFVEIFRPILVGPSVTNEAWLSRQGTALSDAQLQRRICRASEVELGQRISLHLFRHSLATTVSEIAPERIGDAARILGHRQRLQTRRRENRLPAIEFYRQVSGSAYAASKLAELQEHYRVRPHARSKQPSFALS